MKHMKLFEEEKEERIYIKKTKTFSTKQFEKYFNEFYAELEEKLYPEEVVYDSKELIQDYVEWLQKNK
jgi:hypothetical protein